MNGKIPDISPHNLEQHMQSDAPDEGIQGGLDVKKSLHLLC